MKIMVRITSQNGLEVAKAGQIADRWSIGLMVDGSMVNGLMVDRSNSETEGFL